MRIVQATSFHATTTSEVKHPLLANEKSYQQDVISILYRNTFFSQLPHSSIMCTNALVVIHSRNGTFAMHETSFIKLDCYNELVISKGQWDNAIFRTYSQHCLSDDSCLHVLPISHLPLQDHDHRS